MLNEIEPLCCPRGFKCTEHSVGQVTAEKMTLYMRRNPKSPTQRQLKEESVSNKEHLMISN